MEILKHTDKLCSIKVNVRDFLFNNLNFLKLYSYSYLLVANKEYTYEFDVVQINLRRRFDDERFLYEINFDKLVYAVDELSLLFSEFQHWQLLLTDTKLTEFRLYDRNLTEEGVLFFKEIEDDVIWINENDIDDVISKLKG